MGLRYLLFLLFLVGLAVQVLDLVNVILAQQVQTTGENAPTDIEPRGSPLMDRKKIWWKQVT